MSRSYCKINLNWNDPTAVKRYMKDYGIVHKKTDRQNVKRDINWDTSSQKRAYFNTYFKSYYKTHPDQLQAKRCRENENALKKNYGLTLHEYALRIHQQDFKCAICKTDFNGIIYHVDHCHKTGIVRGILCSQCNSMLGMAKDKISNLQSAIQYLSKF